jgi:uncharacterized protein (TIGR00255 family)
MIKSMTGFGLATITDDQSTITVEIKSLNSKFQDFSVRVPKALSDFELEWRNLLNEKLERGKVSLSVEYTKSGKPEVKQSYNQELFKAYYQELKKLADSVSAPSHDQLFQMALGSPDVIQNNGREEMPTGEKEKIKNTVLRAIDQCNQFRLEEGKVLGEKIKSNVQTIRVGLLEVEKLDPARVERIRLKMKNGIAEFIAQDKIDQNRLEQEIIFYIEKLDINEEKVRLKTHLDYFLQGMDSKESNGKKLGFLAQEIGREINTIGSKANDAEIQKQVVMMKEELEKIKEQLNNVL